MLRTTLLACGAAVVMVLSSTSCASPELGGQGALPERTEDAGTPETDHPWSPGEDPIQWMQDRADAGAEWIDPPGTTTPWPTQLMPQDGTPITVDLPAASWLVLDGGADNAVSLGFEGGAPWGYLYLGMTVRAVLWDQSSDADRATGGTATLTMTPAQWAFAVHTVDQGLPFYTGEEREQLVDARADVTTAAAASGADLEPLVAELTEQSTTTRPMDDAWDDALLASLEGEQGW